MKEEMREISRQLQETFGTNRIVIGSADGLTYVDIPDDPEEYADLMMRLQLAVATGHNKHFEAYMRKLTEYEIKHNEDIN